MWRAWRVRAVVAGVLLAAGCSSAGGGTPHRQPASAEARQVAESDQRSDSPTASPAAVTAGRRVPGCRAPDVFLKLVNPDSAKFEQSVTLVVTNTSNRSCVLAPVPGLRLRGANAEYLPTTVVPDGDRKPALTLRPKASAGSLLTWNKYQGTGQECPPFPATLDVSLSGDRHFTDNVTWLTEHDGGSVCDSGRLKARYFAPSG